MISVRQRSDLRLAPANLQALCDAHHNAGKQAEEHRGYSRQVDARGWPVDARHPVNAR